MSMYNKSEFSFSETFNNRDGKTSGSGFIGVILGLVAAGMLVAGTIGFFCGIGNSIEFLDVVIKLVAAVTILLGVRKVASNFSQKDTNNSAVVIDEEKG